MWVIVNPPNEPTLYPVKDVPHALRLIEALAESQLLQREIECNAFGLEVFKDGAWEDWESEDGDSINEVSRAALE